MNTLFHLVVFAAGLCTVGVQADNGCTGVIDIIYVFDSSSSIGQSNFTEMINFARKMTLKLDFGPLLVRVGAVVFSFDPKKCFDLGDYSSLDEIAQHLTDIPFIGHKTRTDKALDFIINDGMFSIAADSSSNSSKTLVVFTDGKSDNPHKTEKAADRIKAQGIIVIVVAIGDAYGPELLAISNGAEYVYKSDNYVYLEYIAETVFSQACLPPP